MLKSSFFNLKKRNQIKYFLVKSILFLLLVFVLDYSIGNILRYFYFKEESGLHYRTTYSIEKTTAEILIFGSSRANHHYDPVIFEKRLHLSCYNVGHDGTSILYHYAVLKGVLKRYLPKIVILDFCSEEFKHDQVSYDKLCFLLPYYKTHPEMRSIIAYKSEFEKIKLLSYIYPYNSSLFTIAVGNTQFNKKRKGDIQGYVPLKKVWSDPIKVDSLVHYEIDTLKIKAYKAFIQDCIDSKIKLYIVCSPYFIKFNHIDRSLLLGKDIVKKNNIRFFDHSKDSLFINDAKLFADTEHLNEKGANVFSNMLIENISKVLKK